MNVEADDLTEMLRESAREYLRRQIPSGATYAGFAREKLWQDFAALGWLGLALPESLGGQGLGIREASALCEVLGQSACPAPYVAGGIMPAVLLGACAATAGTRQLAQRLSSGDTRLALAWQEQSQQSDAAPPQTKLTAGRVSGSKRFVVAAHSPGILLVSVDHAGAPALVAVAADAEGVGMNCRVAGLDIECDMTFDQTPILFHEPLATGSAAAEALQASLLVGRIAQCAQLAGLATGVINKTQTYIGQRLQFGRPLSSFQSIRHRCADLFIASRLASASWVHALQAFERQPFVFSTAAAIAAAKARCGDVAVSAAREAVQMHGAMGFVEAGGVGVFLRAALHGRGWLGSPTAQRRLFTQWQARDAQTRLDAHKPHAPSLTRPSAVTVERSELSDDDFRHEFRSWLEAHYPARFRQDHRRPFRRLRGEDLSLWIALMHRDGWRVPSWPRKAGGMGLSFRKLVIYQQELERIGAARVIENGETQLGPTLIHCGSEAQQRYYLPRILMGKDFWAQGYSEPGAGSDLASLKTRAVRDGDVFVVDGQKIWTTHAQECTHIFLLVRTAAPGQYSKKQQGISFLLVDLKTPGIEIRPMTTIAGEDELCEVFFDAVRVPLQNIVGELDQGWEVAKALLGHERVWLGSAAMAAQALRLSEQIVFQTGQSKDAGVMDRLAQLTADLHDYRLLYAQICDRLAEENAPPGPEVSMLKVYVSELQQRITEFNADIAGEYGGTVGDVVIGDITTDLHWQLMMSRPVTIFAGCNEVQRDIIAKSVLNLPDAPR